jgi:LytS/YehU family sensor histidine kinase
VAGCLVFLSLPVILWPGQGGLAEFFNDSRSAREFTNDILILMFFYLNFYFLIPKLYFPRKYVFFILAVALCFLIVAFLPGTLFPFHGSPDRFSHHEGSQMNRILFTIGHNLIYFLAVVFFSLMVRMNSRWKKAEKERLKAELSYFKAQINPHFLFNTLNSIYSLAIQKADNTPEAVVKLSGMMRYVLSDASNDFVPLVKEIGYITDYIDLQRIRFGDTVTVNFTQGNIDSNPAIAPLILIPFIENAFKFGVNPEKDSILGIKIELSGQEFHMNVFNNKVSERSRTDAPGGLGISNARHRLELLYPEKYRLIIEDWENEYKVDLFIILP